MSWIIGLLCVIVALAGFGVFVLVSIDAGVHSIWKELREAKNSAKSMNSTKD
jgi:hypothetical protein